MREIKLNHNKYAIVDNEDFIYLNNLKWTAVKKYNDWYVILRRVNERRGINIYLQELLIDIENHNCVTFKNKNTLDFRKENLSSISKSLSIQRTRKRTKTHNGMKPSSKYKGVCIRRKRGNITWDVRVAKDKKTYYCGTFEDEKEAAYAYNKKSFELYGKLAYQNKI